MRRNLSGEQIVEKAYSILGEMLFKSAEEGWSFSDFVRNYYISFSKSGVAVSLDLRAVQGARTSFAG